MIRRRTIIGLLAVMLCHCATWAVPAYKGVVQLRQPDGSSISVLLHGDEYLNYSTTTDGYTIMRNVQGYYVYAERQTDEKLALTNRVAHNENLRPAEEQLWLSGIKKHLKPEMAPSVARERSSEVERRAKTRSENISAMKGRRAARYDYKNFNGLVILVEYNDQKFTDGYKTLITNMVNQKNYTGYDNSVLGKCSGSVRDYFYDNSNKLFDPQFDVIGPVAIDYSKYDAHQTKNARQLIKAAAEAAADSVDYKDYDGDGDGYVDMIFFIFAGHSAHYTQHPYLIWPHAGTMSQKIDGVNLGRYACSTELRLGEDCSDYEAIGTICHEFSHVLGLPDLYDVGYDEDGGRSNHPSIWSLMASGNQLNNSRTPAGYGMFERYCAGFATPQTITEAGSYQMQPIGTSNSGYRVNSAVDNEYFLMEYRHPVFKWDQYLPGHGMLVFRVDSTDTEPWDINKINSNPEHNYYELVRAGGGHGATDSDPFPGSGGVTMLGNSTQPANLLSWSGEKSPFELVKIDESDSTIKFDVAKAEQGRKPGEDEPGEDNPDTPGQKGYGVKYWFDDQHELAGQLENFNAMFSLDVSGLSDGVHALHMAVYDNDAGGYMETGAQTVYFVKQPVLSSGRRTDYVYYVDSVKLGSTRGAMDDIHDISIPVKDVEEGLHRLTVVALTPGETQTTVESQYFLRVETAEELGSLRLTCSIDGAVPTTLQRAFTGDSLSYDLDVSELEPGLHSIKYQLTNTAKMLNMPPTTMFFLVDPKLKQYEYWLNGDRSTLTVVGSLQAGNPYEVATELKVRPMPVRSSAFHFAVEEGQPVVYAVNDLTLRAIDNNGSMADSTMQYIDAQSKETITQATLLEKSEPTTVVAPAADKIKWFRIEAYRGDGIRLQASRPCSMHLFSPSGEEIYRVSGNAAKSIAGTNGLETGTYYVAVHDISDGNTDDRELTVTYHPGTSILTALPMASLPTDTTVYRGTKVTLSSETRGALIWYTTDGTEPSLESETTHRYNGTPISINGLTELRAIATAKDMLVSDEASYLYDTRKTNLRWDFAKQWQWLSHNMADDMPASELYDYAECIMSEDGKVNITGGQPTTGSMTELKASASYKVKSAGAAVVERQLDMVNPAEVQIELHKGWNWIGYPVGHSQTLSEALTPREGDIVSGQLGYAIYENGQWSGTLQTLDTGRGYLLMSKTSRVLTFRDQTDSKTQPQKEPFENREGLTVDIYGWPTTMNITGQLYVSGERANAEDYAIGAFCGDECRGVAEPIDGVYYLTVYGNDDDAITLKAVKATTLEMLDVAETFTLTQEAYGSRVSPVRLSTDLPSVVTVNSIKREYGDSNPELTYTVNGSVLRGTPELTCKADELSEAGDYDITIGKGSVENMNVTWGSGTLTVTQAPLTISVGEYSRKEGEENPVFDIIYQGFKNGETEEVLTVLPTATTTATADSPAGEYDIVLGGGEAQNYELIYVNGKLTVIESAGIAEIIAMGRFNVYTLDGLLVVKDAESLQGLPKGIYIVRPANSRQAGGGGRKVVVK